MNRTIDFIRRPFLTAVVALIILTATAAVAQPQVVPAPVPDAVRIPRPTPAEIDAVREGLDAFLQSNAEVRAIAARYPGLLGVTPPPPNTAVIPGLSPRFEEKHQQNRAVARAGDIELLLMGDSITDFWRNTEGAFAGASVIEEYFGEWKIANFGIAGDTTQGVLYRLENGEGEGFSPRAIMLMIGTNNTRANTAAEIAEGVGAIVLKLRSSFPDAKILLLGISPRSTANDPVRDQIGEINDIISRLHDGETVHYLDIGDVFLDANGNIPASVMSDGLHPSTEGYRRWAEAVKDPLGRLMAEN